MTQDESQAAAERRQAARYQPLMIVLAALCAGIVADRVWPLPAAVGCITACCAWIVWLALWWCRWERTAAVAILVSVAGCGAAWHHMWWSLFADDDLGCYARSVPQPVCVEAVATGGPRRFPAPPYDPMQIIPVGDRTGLAIELAGIRDGTQWRPASGRTRLMVDGHLLGVRAGDRLRVFGQLSAPRRAENPAEFDQALYFRADRRLSRLRSAYPDCVAVVGRRRLPSVMGWIGDLRAAGQRLLRRHIDDRRAGLAAAVLLGAREEIGAERAEAFMETGTVHLLAISGLHVGIVAGALFGLLRVLFVPNRRAAVVVAAFTILYALLTDARPPAIRAAILVLVLCGSTYLGRPRLAFNSLAAAALVVLVLNPADLFRVGVQMSFVTVAGLMWFAPRWFGTVSQQERLRRLLLGQRRWPSRFAWFFWRVLRRLTLVGVMLWLLTLPLVMARFHLIAPAAIALNTFLWLPMALALASGFAVLAFGWLVPPLATVAGWCCDGSLWVLDGCIRFARDLPCSHFWVPGPADWWLVGFYGGLAVLGACPAIRPPRRWCLALLAGWVAVGILPGLLRPRGDRLDCTFLSVGHGCCVVLELPSGQTVLYDAGQFSPPQMGAQSVAAYLWHRGVTHLDAVILSHCDADHYNMVPGLLERFSVGAVYVSPVMFEVDNSATVALKEAIRQAEAPIREIVANDRFHGGCTIEVLHPPRPGVLGNDNANSIVLAVEYRGRRILLPGDLEPPGLGDMLAEEPWGCDVVLAPHHGSRRSNPPGLVAWCSPQWVVISGGLGDYDAETAASYHAAGTQVLHTGDMGAVRATIDATGVEVSGSLASGELSSFRKDR